MEALFTLISWGDRWQAADVGPPMLMRHKRCGETVEAVVVTCSCERLRADDVRLERGPDASDGWGTKPHPRAKPPAQTRA